MVVVENGPGKKRRSLTEKRGKMLEREREMPGGRRGENAGERERR